MNFPFKQMLSWKSGNFAPTVLGLVCVLAPILATRNITTYQSTIQFGLAFLAIALIKAKPSPTVLGALFSAMLGMMYFFTVFSTVPAATFWTLTLIFFAVTLVFELGIFKFGPTNSKAKGFLVVPLFAIAFSLLIGLAGYGRFLYNWTTTMFLSLSYIAIMLYCWLYILDFGHYRPLKGKTVFWMNILAVAAALLLFICIYQQHLLPF